MPDIVTEVPFCVQNVSPVPTVNPKISMEVGIEDCLHIEFEYQKSKFHLKDVLVGRIFFLLVRVKIKHMEVIIVKKETISAVGTSGPLNDNVNLATFELMDGAAVQGESVPVRLFLSPLPISPTYANIENKFSVRYYVNLVLVDDDDRRYFKQQEIIFWRRDIASH